MTLSAAQIASCLASGGVVLIPTDTVLGLAASPVHSTAVDEIYALKARPREKNLPIMVANEHQLDALGAIMSPAAKALLASTFMPGPVTLVLAIDTIRAPNWLKSRVEIAIRIPNEPLLLSVLEATGPLMVTSANLSGRDTPPTTEEALAQLNGTPSITVHGKSNGAQPSTIVNCTSETIRFERIGVVSEAAIKTVLEAANV